MEIILSERCKSLTGNLGSGFGYFIVKRKGRFYSVRSKHDVPPDGHWRFILTCAELAKNGLHIADIRVTRDELKNALYEAYGSVEMKHLDKDVYNAADLCSLSRMLSDKKTYRL